MHRQREIAPDAAQLPWTNGVFTAWKSECYRSENTAGVFGLKLLRIAPFRGFTLFSKVMRYLLSVPLTFEKLVRSRPGIIFTLNQPMPLLACVYLYSRLFKVPYVLDSHSTPFKSTDGLKYKIYCLFAKGAIFNINHNRLDAKKVSDMPARSYLVPEIPVDIDRSTVGLELRTPNILVVCSFLWDEPLDIILAAAELTPDVTFYVTGNWRRRAADLQGKATDNIVLLGFISREMYLGYLTRCDAVLTLSTRSQIMQMAAEEALSAATPLVTNPSPILEEVFGDSAVYAPLEARSLHSAIKTVLQDNSIYRERLALKRLHRKAVLTKTVRLISDEMRALSLK